MCDQAARSLKLSTYNGWAGLAVYESCGKEDGLDDVIVFNKSTWTGVDGSERDRVKTIENNDAEAGCLGGGSVSVRAYNSDQERGRIKGLKQKI
jgi:hypothetical protein